MENSSDHISIKEANEALIIITASTTFREEDPTQANRTTLKNADTYTYEQLKERHLQDYQRLFDRCHLIYLPALQLIIQLQKDYGD